MNIIDAFLNRITMYRLVTYGLTSIAALAITLGYVGVLGYSGTSLLLSCALIVSVAFVTDTSFAAISKITRNVESVFITSLILFLILLPAQTPDNAIVLAIGAFVAISSKYFFVIGKRHVFNPAAFAAVVLAFMGTGAVGWWVGTPVLLPLVAVVGLLIVRKIRRFDVFLTFMAASLLAGGVYAISTGVNPLTSTATMLISWPLIFFGTIMLTEPLTGPTSLRGRLVYAALVGVLFAVPLHIGAIYMTSALALLIGNVFARCITPGRRLILTFRERIQIAEHSWEFVFVPDAPFTHTAGQYLEWTIGHEQPDTRGNRRYFTVVSAPGGVDVRFAVRISSPSSSFKKALMALEEGDVITATGRAGDFVLPKNTTEKLLCIAGGIGVTPFVSMVRDLMQKGETRDMVLLYAARGAADFAYTELLDEAHTLGITVVRVEGTLTQERITSLVPDSVSRTVYISGPDGMVRALRATVRSLGIPEKRIHTDYFPGL